MRTSLMLLFAAIFVTMTWITVSATMQRGLFAAGRDLWPDLWFRATLLDAYFGFLTFFVWVAYKEHHWAARGGWFVAIMLLGNFAISAYMMLQLYRLPNFSWEALLLRQSGPNS